MTRMNDVNDARASVSRRATSNERVSSSSRWSHRSGRAREKEREREKEGERERERRRRGRSGTTDGDDGRDATGGEGDGRG